MKKIFCSYTTYIILILILAAILRFAQPGDLFTNLFNKELEIGNDELAIGYNAYSVLKTGKDEFGNSFPLYLQSFGDNKLALSSYLTIPSIAIFGLNQFAIRFPSAILGVLTVLLTFLLVYEFFKTIELARDGRNLETVPPSLRSGSRNKIAGSSLHSHQLALLASLLMALSPWHLIFSRAAFEANIALFWMVLGLWLFLKAKNQTNFGLFVASYFSLFMASFTYHSAKVVIPFLALGLIVFSWKELEARFKKLLFGLFIIFIILPFFLTIFSSQGIARFSGIGILHQYSGVKLKLWEQLREEKPALNVFLVRLLHNNVTNFSLDFLGRYFSHYTFDFLFFTGDKSNSNRYQVPAMGQMYLLEAPFLLMGLYFFIRRRYYFWLFLFLIAPVASSLTFETPSSVRSIFLLPALQVATAFGIWQFFGILKRKQLFFKLAVFVFVAFFFYNFIYYLHQYYIHRLPHFAETLEGGNREMVEAVKALEKDYKEVWITRRKGTPYIYFLFYTKYDPAKFQKQAKLVDVDQFGFGAVEKLDKYTFGSSDCEISQMKSDVLYVCMGPIIPQKVRVLKVIRYANGQPVFIILDNKWTPGMENKNEI